MNIGRGFSLVELLCTVAILMILTVIVTNHGGASAQKKARLSCQANLQKIALALDLYQSDNHGDFPFLDGSTTAESVLSLLVPRDTSMTAIFICPGSKDNELPEGVSFAGSIISYAYYMGRGSNDDGGAVLVTDRQINNLPKVPGQSIFSSDGNPPANNHGKTGGNLLQVNGAVQFCAPVADRDLPLGGKVRLLNP